MTEPGGPRRRCAVTRRVLDKSALIRFVAAPDGAVVADVAQTLPGRGVWIGAERGLVEAACRRKGALARAGRVPGDLVQRCEAALAARALGLLGLARRAGQAAIGARAARRALEDGAAAVLVEAALAARALGLLGLARRAGQAAIGARAARRALEDGAAAVLVQARDAAADGRGKLERLRAAAAPRCAAVTVFDRAEMAAGLGRDAAHAALRRGGLAEKFKTAAGRLAGFRTAADDAGRGSGERDDR